MRQSSSRCKIRARRLSSTKLSVQRPSVYRCYSKFLIHSQVLYLRVICVQLRNHMYMRERMYSYVVLLFKWSLFWLPSARRFVLRGAKIAFFERAIVERTTLFFERAISATLRWREPNKASLMAASCIQTCKFCVYQWNVGVRADGHVRELTRANVKVCVQGCTHTWMYIYTIMISIKYVYASVFPPDWREQYKKQLNRRSCFMSERPEVLVFGPSNVAFSYEINTFDAFLRLTKCMYRSVSQYLFGENDSCRLQ